MATELSTADSKKNIVTGALSEVAPEASSPFTVMVVQFLVYFLTLSCLNFMSNTSIDHQKLLLTSIIFAVVFAWGSKDEKDEFQIASRDDFVPKLNILMANEGYDPLVSKDNWFVFRSIAFFGIRRVKVAFRGENVIIVAPKPAMKRIKDWLRQ